MKILRVDSYVYFDDIYESDFDTKIIDVDTNDYNKIIDIIKQDINDYKNEEVVNCFDDDYINEYNNTVECFNDSFDVYEDTVLTEQDFKSCKNNHEQIMYLNFENDCRFTQVRYFVIF